jgi:ATP/maltotriose-dependent transcriptional regulator MalT
VNRRIRMNAPPAARPRSRTTHEALHLQGDESTMTASRDTSQADQAPTDLGAAAADRAGAELRRVLLHHLALDVRPNRLAEIVVTLCSAIEPMVVSPTVGERGVLSDREVQVLVGMATGSSNAQIGRRLHLSEDTVKTYARRLFRSLGVRDRAHAVAQGFQQGILLIGGVGDRDGFRGVRSIRAGALTSVAALRPDPPGTGRR